MTPEILQLTFLVTGENRVIKFWEKRQEEKLEKEDYEVDEEEVPGAHDPFKWKRPCRWNESSTQFTLDDFGLETNEEEELQESGGISSFCQSQNHQVDEKIERSGDSQSSFNFPLFDTVEYPEHEEMKANQDLPVEADQDQPVEAGQDQPVEAGQDLQAEADQDPPVKAMIKRA